MKKRILVIDDEPDFSRMLKLSLEAEGYYNVREENSPQKALAAAREFMPDVVVLDMMMPWLHGGDVAEQLNADPLFTDTSLVFLTALDEATLATTEIGDQIYLPKGAPVRTLVDSIERLASKRRARETDERTGVVRDRRWGHGTADFKSCPTKRVAV